jgi:hypothetical protein
MKTLLVGICGKKGSGKTLFANNLELDLNTHNSYRRLQVDRYSFAQPLKQVCHILFGGDEQGWFGTDEDKNKKLPFFADKCSKVPTYRRAMQVVGTDLFRNNLYQSIWTDIAYNTIFNFPEELQPEITIIDDIRFKNEAEFVTNNGGITVYIERNTNTPTDWHASEQMHKGMHKFDYCFDDVGNRWVHEASIVSHDVINRIEKAHETP